MSTAETAQQAGALIRLSLTHRAGAPSEEHAFLLSRYLAEPELRRTTDEMCAGLGLRCLSVDTHTGLILCPASQNSPFRMRVADHFARQVTDVRRRLVLAVAVVACFVAFFPRPEDLEETNVRLRRLKVDEIDDLVRDLCSRLEAEAKERGSELDPPLDEPDLLRAWTVYQQTPNAKRSADGRANDRATRQVVVRCLELLADQGVVRRVDRETFAATRRMQVLAGELAGSLIWEQAARSPESSG